MGEYTACKSCGQKLVDGDDPKFYYTDENGNQQCNVEELVDALNNTECPDCNEGHFSFWDGGDLPGNPYCPVCNCYSIKYDKETDYWTCLSCGHNYPDDVYDELPGSIKANSIEEVLDILGIDDYQISKLEIRNGSVKVNNMGNEIINVHPFRGSYQIRSKQKCPECGSSKFKVRNRTENVQWIFCNVCKNASSIPLIFYDRPY